MTGDLGVAIVFIGGLLVQALWEALIAFIEKYRALRTALYCAQQVQPSIDALAARGLKATATVEVDGYVYSLHTGKFERVYEKRKH